MDTQNILKSLSNLEKSLQSVESARQQVEKTVAAYDGAKLQIANLTQELAGISKEFNAIVSAIKSNQQILENTLSAKVEQVFININDKLVVMSSELMSIKNTFASNCNEAATSVKENIAETLRLFNEKVQTEISDIANVLSEFQSIVSAIENEVKTNANNTISSVKSSLKSATDEFQDKLNTHLKAFSDLKGDLQGVLNLQKQYNTEVFVKIETETYSVKNSIFDLDKRIHDLSSNSESNHKELMDILSAIIQGNNPSAEKMSARFNAVDGNLGTVKNEVTSVSTQLGMATTQIIDENKQSLLSEVTAVKLENANIKKMVVLCLVAIFISVLLNIVILIR